MERIEPIRLPLLGIALLIALVVGVLLVRQLGPGHPVDVSWTELVYTVEAHPASEILVEEDRIQVTVDGPDEGAPAIIQSDRLPHVDDGALIERWRADGAAVHAEAPQQSWFMALLASLLLPLVLLLALGWFLRSSLQRGASSALDFGRGKPRIFDRTSTQPVTFDDVAGLDEAKAELEEIIAFLTDPQRYRTIGARLPKGTLLVGPPGTGKTLLARAVAGEAQVPFFSISGSEFVEMFVGVGASRVRDLFEQAREQAPCIVFIDELDAIGKSREGLATMSTNEEREQTLNQLLVEMDGFDPQTGVVIMAATNRPEILDAALLRSGRFDRRVMVDRPDIAGREAILRVHVRGVQLGPDVDLHTVARRTPGMVGADLAMLVNEAALAAVRRSAPYLEAQDFDHAVDRVQLGLEQKSRVMSPDEKRRVAYHEAGHALVAMEMPHADPVHKVTIIPRSVGALGATLQLPTEDRYLLTREELLDRIAILLGGRAAEQLACDDISTGAEDDLERATRTARTMVTRYGMSDSLGLATTDPAGARFLPQPLGFPQERVASEHTATLVDQEVREILDTQLARALGVLEARRDTLERVVERLLEVETLDADALRTLSATPASG